ncbi:hypothetical protein PoB_004206300 [Plakobranchus ocellatus]|uniref:Uncharacterized protein n=1 Tax=Plakobranchus ocellatus TaxID=259542 RepID=A0AAV4B8R7_9GAST|nr:hypothetical protein PoB_004206300 [Plakobranchus ocellatus]
MLRKVGQTKAALKKLEMLGAGTNIRAELTAARAGYALLVLTQSLLILGYQPGFLLNRESSARVCGNGGGDDDDADEDDDDNDDDDDNYYDEDNEKLCTCTSDGACRPPEAWYAVFTLHRQPTCEAFSLIISPDGGI